MIARSVAESYNYYVFAKTFGWTPSQTDEVEDATLFELSLFIDEFAKEEERQMKKSARK